MTSGDEKKNRLKNFFGNMALFTIGNFVSKLLVMLLVPLYTNVLTTQEYGVADGLHTTILLLVPLLTVNIGEAALRFGIERRKEQGSNGSDVLLVMLKYVAIADIVVVMLCGAGYFVTRLAGVMLPSSLSMEAVGGIRPQTYFLLFELYFISNSLYECMILFCQGCERIKVMIAGSIACTVLMITSNIVLLLVVKAGLAGYLASLMIAFAGAGLLMLFGVRDELPRLHDRLEPDSQLEREMTGYGRSMMLYSVSSWINNLLDRYFVIAMCGAAANGLYAVAYKIPAILTVFQRIFAQAWQISANKTYNDEDAAVFFSNVYEGYQCVMTVGCAFLILVVRIVARLLFAKDFYEAWILVPPLLISVIFGALTGFLGSVCLAFKDGRSMGRATLTGAVVNIVLNYFLISRMGPMGAAIATMISYYVMYIMSFRAAKKHVDFRVRTTRDMLAYLALSVEFLFICCYQDKGYIVPAVCFVLILAMYLKRLTGVISERFLAK